MLMHPYRPLIVFLLTINCCFCKAQQPDSLRAIKNFPERYISRINSKVDAVDKKLSRQTLKALKRFKQQETKLEKRLYAKDSVAAANIFGYSAQKLGQLQEDFTNMTGKILTRFDGEYNAYVDTLKCAFKGQLFS